MPWRRLVLVSLAVFLTRAPFVPPALEDYDSVNFALALEEFDPLAHQPHPPGYPVYVALARAVFTAVPEPSLALGLLSALAQALAVFPAFAVFSSLDRRLAWPASLLLFTCPAVWFNGARPLSDSVGLLFTLGAQALLLRHLEAGRGLPAGSLLAGVGLGVRLQSLLLTAPLWLLAVYRRGPRLKATAAGILGVALWLVPLLVLSGGPSRYLTAFGETMGMALDIEPLFTRFSLNLAARAAGFVLIGPWVAPALGALMLGLALIGTWPMALRQRRGLALALLCFGPYLLAHAAFQQVEAVRYALPYVPLLCLLAAAGIAWLVGLTKVQQVARVELGLAALLGAGAAVLTLPALWVYAAVASPPEAAVDAVRAVAEGRPPSRAAGPGLFRRGGTRPRAPGPRKDASPAVPGFLLASHYTLQRYTADLPEDLEVLASGPTDTVPRLIRYWLDGGRKDTLFLADARRTDLASIDRRAQRLLGRWEWPLHADRFMPGARPARTELVEIAPPGWATGPGWLLSLEAGRPEEMGVLPERLAYLRSLDEPAFLLLAGEPAGEPAGCTLDLDVDGESLDSMPCGGPFLRALTLPPRSNGGYATLRLRSPGPDGSTPSSVLLRGLDYGPRRRTGWVHGPGWHYPERDEQGRLFRWTSARARSLVHVPEGGAWLRIEGTAPVGYVGTGGLVSLRVDGSEVARTAVGATGFTLEVRLPDTPEADGEVTLESERSFVPDEFQRNGDLRELGVRIYRFELRRRGFGSRALPVPAGADETSEARR